MTQATAAKTNVVTGIIDGDGHIFEKDKHLYPYLAAKYKPFQLYNYYFFPDLDGRRRLGRGPEWGPDDAEGWIRFLDHSGITSAVLYPTAALGFGFCKDPKWAVDVSAAYNDFISDAYLKVSSRFQAVALIPVQDPAAAATELRRAVTELGFVGGLLPSPGLKRAYGDASFDPLYQEAQRLGVMLAVHGASWRVLGAENYDRLEKASLLAHPITQMTEFTHMMNSGVWERFPDLKVAFLEASCGWVPFLLERMDQRTPKDRRRPSEVVRNSPIYFHAELADGEILQTAISYIGSDRLIYASDFPHEPVDEIEELLQEFLNRDDLSLQVKEGILRDNIKSLYATRV